MFKVFNSVYSPLSSRSESPRSDEEQHRFIGGKPYHEDTSSEPRSIIPRFSIILPWFLVVLNLGLFLNQYLRHPNEFECARLLSPYSPAVQPRVIEYYDTTFENEFGLRTEYTGPPTPELEERWDALWSRGSVELPLDGPAKLNKSTEGLMHAMKDPNRGYAAVLEVFHHLHCLNQIRQYTWKDYYATHLSDWIAKDNHAIVDLNIKNNHSVGDRMHVDHCIEALRLNLMCNADVTPLLIEVDESSTLGQKSDFNVHHKCRNWEKVTEWQYENSIERREHERQEKMKQLGSGS